MTGHLRIKSPNTQLGILLLAYFLPQFILAVIIKLILGDKADLTKLTDISLLKIIQAVSTLVFFFIPALIFARLSFRGKYFYLLGFRAPEKPNMYYLGVAAMLVAFPMVFWLGEINQLVPLPESMIAMEKRAGEQMEAFLKINSPADIFINLFVIAFLPALCEEMFFRGGMQRVLIHMTKKPWVGILITAALFSAFHLQFQGFLPRFFLGAILGAIYWYSGSIWTSIIAHFITNGVQVVVASYATKYINENPQVPVYLALLSGVAVVGIMTIFRRSSTANWAKVYDREGLTPYNDFIAK